MRPTTDPTKNTLFDTDPKQKNWARNWTNLDWPWSGRWVAHDLPRFDLRIGPHSARETGSNSLHFSWFQLKAAQVRADLIWWPLYTHGLCKRPNSIQNNGKTVVIEAQFSKKVMLGQNWVCSRFTQIVCPITFHLVQVGWSFSKTKAVAKWTSTLCGQGLQHALRDRFIYK